MTTFNSLHHKNSSTILAKYKCSVLHIDYISQDEMFKLVTFINKECIKVNGIYTVCSTLSSYCFRLQSCQSIVT